MLVAINNSTAMLRAIAKPPTITGIKISDCENDGDGNEYIT